MTRRPKVPHFVISETPRFVGRAVAALAADPDRARWNGQSLSSGELAKVYGFTDVDGSRPDAWRYVAEVQDAGKPADAAGYRQAYAAYCSASAATCILTILSGLAGGSPWAIASMCSMPSTTWPQTVYCPFRCGVSA